MYCGNRRFPYFLHTFVGIPQTVNLIVANRVGLSLVLTIDLVHDNVMRKCAEYPNPIEPLATRS
jgi:hypothetical protein